MVKFIKKGEKMSREIEQFEQDFKFIMQRKDNWIFKPLYELTRILVLYYEEFYGKDN